MVCYVCVCMCFVYDAVCECDIVCKHAVCSVYVYVVCCVGV